MSSTRVVLRSACSQHGRPDKPRNSLRRASGTPPTVRHFARQKIAPLSPPPSPAPCTRRYFLSATSHFVVQVADRAAAASSPSCSPGKRARRPWAGRFRFPRRLHAIWAVPLGPVGANFWQGPSLRPPLAAAARSSWAGANVRSGWCAASSRSRGRGPCGSFPHASARARAHAAAVGAATPVDRAGRPCVH